MNRQLKILDVFCQIQNLSCEELKRKLMFYIENEYFDDYFPVPLEFTETQSKILEAFCKLYLITLSGLYALISEHNLNLQGKTNKFVSVGPVDVPTFIEISPIPIISVNL